MIDSIRITHDELEGGTYRVLADFFRLAGVHVYGYVPGKDDSVDECDICIYVPDKESVIAKKAAVKDEETEGAKQNDIPKGMLAMVSELGKATSEVTASLAENEITKINVDITLKANEIEIEPVQDKETYMAAFFVPVDGNAEDEQNWNTKYQAYLRNYLLDCIQKIRETMPNDDSSVIGSDFEALSVLADVFVRNNLLLHYNAYTVLYDDRITLKEAQDALYSAYKDVRESLKVLPESKFLCYARMNIAKSINETCSFLEQRLLFDTKLCLDELDRILKLDPSFYSVYVLKAYFAEIDPEYDHLSMDYYKKALDSMKLKHCKSYPCYRMGRYYEKIQRDMVNANKCYQLSFNMNRVEYRAVYKKMQAEKGRKEYISAAESCKEICHILHMKEEKNYLHPREYEYLFKAYNELAKIYSILYKDSAEYELAEKNRRRICNAILDVNPMYKLIFGDRADEYAKKTYNWLDNCKKY